MKRKITVLSSLVICVAVLVTVFGFGADSVKTDTTMVEINMQYAKETSATTNAIGSLIENVAGGNVIGDALNGAGQNLGSALEGVTGNLSGASGNVGDALGNVSEALGSIGNGGGLAGVVGGLGDAIDGISGALSGLTTTKPATTELDTINPVPAVSQYDTEVANPIVNQNTTEPTTTLPEGAGETVDYSATYNPYKKPTIELKAGDKDNSVKWVQWIFIYTHYGLREDGITGVLDDDTVHLIKKLQAEKGLTVDGNMTKDFVDSLELYFYECTFGTGSTTAEPLTQPTQMETTVDTVSGEKNSNLPILIVSLIFIWVLAIVAIVVLVIFLKKKKGVINKNETPVTTNTEAEKVQTEETNGTEKKTKTLQEFFDEDNK